MRGGPIRTRASPGGVLVVVPVVVVPVVVVAGVVVVVQEGRCVDCVSGRDRLDSGLLLPLVRTAT